MDQLRPPTPREELTGRLEKLQLALQKRGVHGALIIQKTDFYYFTGTSQQGWLYVPQEGKPLLMIFKDYQRAVDESGLDQVVSLVSPKKIPQVLGEWGYSLPKIVGMELDVVPANIYFLFGQIFSSSELVDISTDIRLIRSVKSSYEIDILRQACSLSDRVAERATELIEVGKTEVQLAGEIEAYARSLGHQGIVRMRLFGSELFYGHLMSGASAAVASYLASPTGGEGVSRLVGQGPGFKKIARNETILVDYVFALDGYISDHTRVFSIGEPASELLAGHEAMVEIQDAICRQAFPGVVSGELYEEMVAMAEARGYGANFMGEGERKIRFTGHGVGLELDEFPFIAKGQTLALEEGMVIALEPKLIFSGLGVVGIENTHVVTKDGLESLGRFDNRICVI